MFKMMLRSLRRNRRRTVLTALAIALATLLVFVFRCLQESTYSHVIANVSHLWMGSARIAPPSHLDNPSLSDAFPRSLQISIPGITLAPRIEGYALISWKDRTMGSAVVGIDPDNDPATLRRYITIGRWLNRSGEIVLGLELAKALSVNPGDAVALITQGRDGSLGAGLYTVTGLFRTAFPEMNRTLAVITLDDADQLYAMGGRISYLAAFIPDPMRYRLSPAMHRRLQTMGLRWFAWKDLMPELYQAIELDRTSGFLYYFILIAVVGFGLLNTVYMSIYERRKEIAVLRAIGFSRGRLIGLLVGEGILLAGLGFLTGILLSAPIFAILHDRPIVLSGELAEMVAAWGFEPALYLDFRPDILGRFILWLILGAGGLSLIPGYRVTRLPLPEILKFEK